MDASSQSRAETYINAKVAKDAKEREALQQRKALTRRTQRVTAEDAEDCKMATETATETATDTANCN